MRFACLLPREGVWEGGVKQDSFGCKTDIKQSSPSKGNGLACVTGKSTFGMLEPGVSLMSPLHHFLAHSIDEVKSRLWSQAAWVSVLLIMGPSASDLPLRFSSLCEVMMLREQLWGLRADDTRSALITVMLHKYLAVFMITIVICVVIQLQPETLHQARKLVHRSLVVRPSSTELKSIFLGPFTH